MRKCSLNALNAVFAEIAQKAALYLPVDQTDGSAAGGHEETDIGAPLLAFLFH